MIDYEGMILARAEAYDAGEIGEWCEECPYQDRCYNDNYLDTITECFYEKYDREVRQNEE